jgi:hypothetical protein
MKIQISAIASSGWSAFRRWSRDLERVVARSSWTHRAVAGAAILGVFAVVGLLVLQTGWARPAAAEGQQPVQPISTQGPDLQALEFTLGPDAVRAISMDEARAFND